MTTVPVRAREVGQHGRFFAVIILGVWLAAAVGAGVAQAGDSEPNNTIPAGPYAVYLPAIQSGNASLVEAQPTSCPTISSRVYEAIPVDGAATDHPDGLHGDLNLSLRGFVATKAALTLVNINGATDGHAPQMPGLFHDQRTPALTSAHRVYDWNWDCGDHGCRADGLTATEVALLGMGAAAGETISFPSREPEIYGGAYKVLVLYAEEERITLGYTRHDTVAAGYAVHLEQICVDPNLLALYRQTNADGRGHLPALHNGDVLGTAPGEEILVAMRDRGTFMDPRSRKDWWKGR